MISYTKQSLPSLLQSQPSRRSKLFLAVLWTLCLIAIPIWAHYDAPAWDSAIYYRAVHSIQLGNDPYADGIAAQKAAHALAPDTPSPGGPFSYVYSPITLPILRLAAILPFWLVATLFALFYAAGVCGELWFGTQIQDPTERRLLAFLTPLALFFPGFLGSDIILSGNVAFMLYGSVLAATVFAVRRGQWRWFYFAVLAASCFKAPLLSLLAIPLLTARKQWLPAGVTAFAGLSLFAIQPLLWPTLFHNYLQAVELQFSYNRDFGFSPAGLFSGVLYDHHIPYSPASGIFYLLYAIPLFAFLFYLSRRQQRGDFTMYQWLPVLIAGVILLNPRLIEYDAAPLALPLAVIVWRFFAGFATKRVAAICMAIIFGAVNIIATSSWQSWKLTAGPVLVLIFAAGVYTLLRPQTRNQPTGVAEHIQAEAILA